jgi:hypothetical protein
LTRVIYLQITDQEDRKTEEDRNQPQHISKYQAAEWLNSHVSDSYLGVRISILGTDMENFKIFLVFSSDLPDCLGYVSAAVK